VKAIRQHETGDADVLHLEDVERPEPLPTEVLVRVDAAGVNPVDWKTRSGAGMAEVFGDPPFTVGWDVAGEIEETGFGVTRFAPRDRVFGMPWFPRQAAAYAEYVTAPSRHFARVPEGLGAVEAAALPLAALTAWQVLVDTARLREGQRVLVHAAAGGVGHLAVQIAKSRGAHVIGTASAGKHDFLRELGADEAVDYREVRFEEAVEPVDLVVDLVGGDHAWRSLEVVREGGLLVAVPSGVDAALIEEARTRGRRATGILVEPDGAALEQIAGLVASDRLRVHVSEVLPLAEAAEAHRRGETGRTRGKIVLDVRG
jgi:NADPH:quinone reductase-like Zn-dependent oxidoreductase